MNNNIVLVGYMGSGKTTVGHALAERSGMIFADTDDIISENEGCTINEIFEKHGEQYFRDLETKLLENMCGNTQNTVISCGGGMPLREINRTYLKKIGKVIYLSVSADTVFNRLKGDDTRPLLKGNPDEVKEKIKTMLAARDSSYNDAADITVNVDDKSVEDIVSFINESLK